MSGRATRVGSALATFASLVGLPAAAFAVGATPVAAAAVGVPIVGPTDIPSSDLEIVPPYTGYRPPVPGGQVAGFGVEVDNKGPDPAQVFVTVTGLDLSLGLPTEVDCGNTGFQQVTCFLNRRPDPVQSVYFTVPICSMGRTVTISVRPDGVDPFPDDNSLVVDGAPIPAEWVTSCAPRPTPTSPVPAPSSPAGGHGSGGSGGSISTGSGGGPAPAASPTASAAPTTVIEPGSTTGAPEVVAAGPTRTPGVSTSERRTGSAGWVAGGAAGAVAVLAAAGAGFWWRRRRRPAIAGAPAETSS